MCLNVLSSIDHAKVQNVRTSSQLFAQTQRFERLFRNQMKNCAHFVAARVLAKHTRILNSQQRNMFTDAFVAVLTLQPQPCGQVARMEAEDFRQLLAQVWTLGIAIRVAAKRKSEQYNQYTCRSK